MKITTTYLRQVIKEELSAVLREEEEKKYNVLEILELMKKHYIDGGLVNINDPKKTSPDVIKDLDDELRGFQNVEDQLNDGVRSDFIDHAFSGRNPEGKNPVFSGRYPNWTPIEYGKVISAFAELIYDPKKFIKRLEKLKSL